jgi:radical SAM-linked protein
VSYWLVHFSRRGVARYMSHLDTVRALHRTFARAGIALAFSEGMRPKPRLSVVVPLPVGAAARDELVVVEPDAELVPETATQTLGRLRDAGAAGLRIDAVDVCETRPRPRVVSAEYTCALRGAPEALAAAAVWLGAQPQTLWQRTSPKGRREIDLSRSLTAIAATETDSGVALTFSIKYLERGTARPDEIVAAVAERSGIEAIALDMERVDLTYEGLPPDRPVRRGDAHRTTTRDQGVDET